MVAVVARGKGEAMAAVVWSLEREKENWAWAERYTGKNRRKG
jgi:hypothetical protein